MAGKLEEVYSHIAEFVDAYGWIEIGHDEFSTGFVRAFDMGGTVWTGKSSYASLDDVLADLEQGLAAWMQENFGEA